MTGALGLFTAGRWSVFRCHASCEHSARVGKPQHRQAFGFGLGPVVFGYFQSRNNRLASTRPASGPSSRPTQRRKEREPFEAELLVLFGLPAIIILIPWALGDPSGLLIIPLVLLIPGPRDIILAVVRDSYIKMRKAKRFIKNEPALGHFEENSATNRHVYPKRRIKRARRQAAGADDTVIEVRPIKITEATAPSTKSPVKYAAINEKLHNDTLITTQDMESSGDGVVKSTSFKRKFKDRHRNRSHSKYKGVRNIRRTYDDENEPLMRIQPKEQTSQRRIPWFARPLVVILPFLKDWGGFIT